MLILRKWARLAALSIGQPFLYHRQVSQEEEHGRICKAKQRPKNKEKADLDIKKTFIEEEHVQQESMGMLLGKGDRVNKTQETEKGKSFFYK